MNTPPPASPDNDPLFHFCPHAEDTPWWRWLYDEARFNAQMSWRAWWSFLAASPCVVFLLVCGFVAGRLDRDTEKPVGFGSLPLKPINEPAGHDWMPFAEILDGEAVLIWRDDRGDFRRPRGE